MTVKFSKKFQRIKIKNIHKGTDPHRDAFVSDCGLFAVHKDFYDHWWTLTHIPTGHSFGCGCFETPKKARDFCKRIYGMIDWRKIKVKINEKAVPRRSETITPKGVDSAALGAEIKKILEKYL